MAGAWADRNQIFYAALWWTALLPGGVKAAIQICEDSDQPVPEFMADIPEFSGRAVTHEQASRFFDGLFNFLLENEGLARYTSKGKKRFIQLEKGESSFPYAPGPAFLSAALRYGLGKADLSDYILPQGKKMYIHDDGQLFIMWPPEKAARNLGYPGQAPLAHKYTTMRRDDFDDCPELCMISYYRVVEVTPEQTVKPVSLSRSGAREVKAMNPQSEQIMVAFGSLENLKNLTDEEIISGSDKVHSSHLALRELYTPGYYGTISEERIRTTDIPGIVMKIGKPMPCMDVTSPIQFGYGEDFIIANPGDKLILDRGDGDMQVLYREEIEQGFVSLAPPEPGLLRQTSFNFAAPGF